MPAGVRGYCNAKRNSQGKTMKTILMLLALASLGGCATITRGTSEVLVVETEPPGAEATITPGRLRCTTPCTLELKRKHDYFIDLNKPGYEPAAVTILSQITGAGAAGMAGDVLLGGLIGAGVDAFSGATKGLKPNPVKVNLVKIEQPGAPADPVVSIARDGGPP